MKKPGLRETEKIGLQKSAHEESMDKSKLEIQKAKSILELNKVNTKKKVGSTTAEILKKEAEVLKEDEKPQVEGFAKKSPDAAVLVDTITPSHQTNELSKGIVVEKTLEKKKEKQ